MVVASYSSMTAITRSKRRWGPVILTTPPRIAIVANRWSVIVIGGYTRLQRNHLWTFHLPLFDAHTAMTYLVGQLIIGVRASAVVAK
jgi:hypothetical protein